MRRSDVNPNSVSLNRRGFLMSATGALLSSGLSSSAFGAVASRRRKVVVVTFGGGARDEETFSLDGQENIPHLLKELAPRSTFFTQVVNKGILGHYVATASLTTGVYETFNNFAAVPPDNPTIFEYYRKDLKRPSVDTWVVAPSNGFNRIGESGHRSYGAGLGAGVILPKRLLKAALASGGNTEYDRLLRDNYETPLYAPTLGGAELHLQQIADVLKLSATDFLKHASSLASADELSVYIAKQLMRQLAPSLVWITLHDIDVAHAGCFSLYVDAIQRCDRLCGEIWNAIQTEPEYAGNTTMFILPDFGRDGDDTTGGNGFQHHRTGDPQSRTTWMLALGLGARENLVVDRPIESVDLTPTVAKLLGASARFSQGKPVSEVV